MSLSDPIAFHRWQVSFAEERYYDRRSPHAKHLRVVMSVGRGVHSYQTPEDAVEETVNATLEWAAHWGFEPIDWAVTDFRRSNGDANSGIGTPVLSMLAVPILMERAFRPHTGKRNARRSGSMGTLTGGTVSVSYDVRDPTAFDEAEDPPVEIGGDEPRFYDNM